jgi:hypothetical protein
MISSTIMLSVMAGVLGLVNRAQGTFHAQLEMSDLQQRLRVGVGQLTNDLLAATAVRPYLAGPAGGDPQDGVFYRPDAITILHPSAEQGINARTYYLTRDLGSRTFELVLYEGDLIDRPVVDHVVKLEFEYFGVDHAPLEGALLGDGPWQRADDTSVSLDVDLLRIMRVRVMLRVQAALESMRGPAGILFMHGGTSTSIERYIPDREIRFDVSPRNLTRQ